jgi:hypothetical protein
MKSDDLICFDFDEVQTSDLLDFDQTTDFRRLFEFFSGDASTFSVITPIKLKELCDKMGLSVTISQCDKIVTRNSIMSGGEVSFISCM